MATTGDEQRTAGSTAIIDWVVRREADRCHRTVGYVGEDGIETNVPYRCNTGGKLVRAEGEAMTDAWHFLPDDGMTHYEPRARRHWRDVACRSARDHLQARRTGLSDAIDAAIRTRPDRLSHSAHRAETVHGDDKIVSSERTITLDVRRHYRHARVCMLRCRAALLLADVGDARYWQAIGKARMAAWRD